MYEVTHNGIVSHYPTQDSAESAITDLCLAGYDCTLIYPDDYGPYGCPPPEDFPKLDANAIIAAIGQSSYDALRKSDAFGYIWYANILAGDSDTIAESKMFG